jgi:hypothetical protein
LNLAKMSNTAVDIADLDGNGRFEALEATEADADGDQDGPGAMPFVGGMVCSSERK